MDPVTALLDILDLERLEVDLFRGHSPNTEVQRVFGGQVIGQALVAAYRTISERPCHSLHAYFLRPGDPRVPIIYQVERVRDGSSFSVRRVVAIQHGKPIFNLGASFHKSEPGFEHQTEMPDVPGPEETPYTWDDVFQRIKEIEASNDEPAHEFAQMQPVVVKFPDLFAREGEPALSSDTYVWFKANRKLDVASIKHQCILAYATDMSLLDTCVRPHAVAWGSSKVMMASLDHAIWFHAPIKSDEWMLYVKDTPQAGGARGFNRGAIYSQSGQLLASVAQEGLIRPRSKPKP